MNTTRDSRPESDNGEVQRIVGAQSDPAQKLIEQHRAADAGLTEHWLKNETLNGSVVKLAVEPSAVAAAAR